MGRHKAAVVGAIVFLLALAAIGVGLSQPGELYFDETWYVPAARELLNTGDMLRQEHPPLGKLLIALSMAMFGDDPLGWRALDGLFGALTLAGMYAWTLAMTRSILWGAFAAALGFFGAVVYVQARIAMLDMFLMGFGMWALAFFAFSLEENLSAPRAFRWLLASGASLGLSTACKVSGAFLWAGLGMIALLIVLMRHWQASFARPGIDDFASPSRWRGVSVAQGLVALLGVPIAAYAATYLQQTIHTGNPGEIFASHWRMHDILSGDAGTHPYSSPWWKWPTLIRPVWYYFKIPGGEASTWSAALPAVGVVALPNPFLTILGELAILYALVRWALTRSLNALLVATAFFSQYLPWIIDPKGLEFSFYFFPSLLATPPTMAVALAEIKAPMLRRSLAGVLLVGGAGLFFFFLPLLSAAIGDLSPDAFSARVWFSTWR